MIKYNTIFFDLDGTIVDSSQTILNGFNYALKPFGINVSSREVETMRIMTSNQLFRDLLTESEAKQALKRLWYYSENSAIDTILIPDIHYLLKKITKKNMMIGVWTGRDRASTIKILKHHNIDHYVKEIVGGCEVKMNKPNPEGLLLLANKLKAQRELILHVGDHDHDLLAANAAGVTAVHAKWCQSDIENAHALIANFTFHSVDDFSQWIDRTA